jgi:hypothetical protein
LTSKTSGVGFGIWDLKDGRRKAFEAGMNREDGSKGGANQDLQNGRGRACEEKQLSPQRRRERRGKTEKSWFHTTADGRPLQERRDKDGDTLISNFGRRKAFAGTPREKERSSDF